MYVAKKKSDHVILIDTPILVSKKGGNFVLEERLAKWRFTFFFFGRVCAKVRHYILLYAIPLLSAVLISFLLIYYGFEKLI